MRKEKKIEVLFGLPSRNTFLFGVQPGRLFYHIMCHSFRNYDQIPFFTWTQNSDTKRHILVCDYRTTSCSIENSQTHVSNSHSIKLS